MTAARLAFLRLRPRPTPTTAPRPNPTEIAVLEHDLLGVQPEPGSMAALAIALRRTGTCLTPQPIETTGLADPRPTGMCTGCGANMIQDDHGDWLIA